MLWNKYRVYTETLPHGPGRVEGLELHLWVSSLGISCLGGRLLNMFRSTLTTSLSALQNFGNWEKPIQDQLTRDLEHGLGSIKIGSDVKLDPKKMDTLGKGIYG